MPKARGCLPQGQCSRAARLARAASGAFAVCEAHREAGRRRGAQARCVGDEERLYAERRLGGWRELAERSVSTVNEARASTGSGIGSPTCAAACHLPPPRREGAPCRMQARGTCAPQLAAQPSPRGHHCGTARPRQNLVLQTAQLRWDTLWETLREELNQVDVRVPVQASDEKVGAMQIAIHEHVSSG